MKNLKSIHFFVNNIKIERKTEFDKTIILIEHGEKYKRKAMYFQREYRTL